MSMTPGPWEVDDYCGTIIWAPNPYGEGRFHVADVRGWGHLTGRGHGGLGFSEKEATKIQDANARAIAAVPELVRLLKDAAPYVSMIDYDMEGADGGEAKRLFDEIIALLRRIEGASDNDR